MSATLAASTSLLSYILCWDFDWTLINENTDIWCIKALDPLLLDKYNRKKEKCWTDNMDNLMTFLYDNGYKSQDILNTFKNIPYFKEIIDIIKLCNAYNIKQYIISDSNTLFIEYTLKYLDLLSYFPKENIFTNDAYIHNDIINIRPLFFYNHEKHDDITVSSNYRISHNCNICPSNLCKKIILDEIKSTNNKNIIYLGDGHGDFCPTKSLNKNDIVFAREGYEGPNNLGREFALGALWHGEILNDVSPNVLYWKNGADLYIIFSEGYEGPNNLGREFALWHDEILNDVSPNVLYWKNGADLYSHFSVLFNNNL